MRRPDPGRDNAAVARGEVGKANNRRIHHTAPPLAVNACLCRLGRGCLICRGWDRLIRRVEMRRSMSRAGS